MSKIKIELGELKIAKNIIEQLQFTDEHNKFIVELNLKAFKEIIIEADDELRYKNIELAEVNEKGHIIKDEKGNLIFNKENTIAIEKFAKKQNIKLVEVEVKKFRDNSEIKKLTPVIRNLISFLLIEKEEPKNDTEIVSKEEGKPKK